MRIIGVDPGLAKTGFGIVDFFSEKFNIIECGYINTEPELTLPNRLHCIYRELQKVIEGLQPEHFAIEELFFNKNSLTALVVGQARGVAILTAANAGLLVFEYTPLQVKQAITGYGRASKKQVRYMVRKILRLKEAPKPDDISDALAVAICHAFSSLGGRVF